MSVRYFFNALTMALALCLAGSGPSPAEETPPSQKVEVSDATFGCIRDMTPVRHFYVANLLGNIKDTLAAANAPQGAEYPVGSVVQLVPTEVMVKHEPGFSPETHDWEFFQLAVDAKGSKIETRGFAEVNNRFGKNCFACHAPAAEPWDFICESGHGCEPLPIDHTMTGALQRTDPRCGAPALQSGDTYALIKLKALIMLGAAANWIHETF